MRIIFPSNWENASRAMTVESTLVALESLIHLRSLKTPFRKLLKLEKREIFSFYLRPAPHLISSIILKIEANSSKKFYNTTHNCKPMSPQKDSKPADYTLIITILTLVLGGFVMIYSASAIWAERHLGQPLYFLKRQSLLLK